LLFAVTGSVKICQCIRAVSALMDAQSLSFNWDICHFYVYAVCSVLYSLNNSPMIKWTAYKYCCQ
jgi:hypothetical protein